MSDFIKAVLAFWPEQETISGEEVPTIMSTSIKTNARGGYQAEHSNVVTSVAFSKDGRLLASGSWDGSIKLWDTTGGKLKLTKTLRGEWDEVEAVVFTPDGRAVAGLGTGYDQGPYGEVTVWGLDEDLGRPLARAGGKLEAMAFSPDGTTLAIATGDSRSVMLWDLGTGLLKTNLADHPGPVWSVDISPDGKLLVAASGAVPMPSGPTVDESPGELRTWELSASKKVCHSRLTGHRGGVIATAFTPDGATLASGGFDRTVKLWKVGHDLAYESLEGHEGWVSTVAFAADNRTLASGSHDQTIRLWDVASARELATLRGHTGNIYSVSFSPDCSRLASGSLDGTVRLWNLGDFLEA